MSWAGIAAVGHLPWWPLLMPSFPNSLWFSWTKLNKLWMNRSIILNGSMNLRWVMVGHNLARRSCLHFRCPLKFVFCFVEWLIIWTSLRPARISNKCFFSGKLWSPRVGIKLLQLNKIMNECIWTHRKTCNLLTFSPRGTQNPVAISLKDSGTWLESLEGDPKSSFIKLLGRKTTNLNEVLFEFLRQALNPRMPMCSLNFSNRC